MKKTLTKLALLSIFATTIYPAVAETVLPKDISDDCDAKQSIEVVLTKEVMQVDEEGNFSPDKDITRAEFLHALLKILNTDTKAECTNSFSDVKEGDKYYNDILLSKQLGLICGYENGTFMPDAPISHSEATSIISHITKDKFIDCSTLVPYTDKNDIPDWAKLAYSKSINYGVVITDKKDEKSIFEPTKNLSRKESAIVFKNIIDKLTPPPEPEAKPIPEHIVSYEHIAYDKKSLDGVVHITNLRKVIVKENTFFAKYDGTKNICLDDKIRFVLPDGLKTNEGTELFPKGTELYATITNVKPVTAKIHTVKLKDGECTLNANLVKQNLRKLKQNKDYQITINEDFIIEN